jgi:hypothetical protein
MPSDTASRQHRIIYFNARSWLLVYDYDPAAAGLSCLPAWLVLCALADLTEVQVAWLGYCVGNSSTWIAAT